MSKFNHINKYLSLFFKGAGMGAANVIPGVSGGTVALITGIFEKLIHSIKSFDLEAIRLLFTGKFRMFSKHVNLDFLIAVFAGIAVSIISLAKLLGYLFDNYPVYVWAYFFGLILASIYFVGKTISHWHFSVILSMVTGTVIAVLISVLRPAVENDSFMYLVLCGIVAICSMILPGLSGSFVLVLMGNYKLVMINAVSYFRLEILFPVFLGAVFGLLAFSRFLSWIYRKVRNQTIALLTGFILGSLSILWPWQKPVILADVNGIPILKDGKHIISGYKKFIPGEFNQVVIIVIVLVLIGFATILVIEKLAQQSDH
jgi:putative membrane protein